MIFYKSTQARSLSKDHKRIQ